MEIKSVIIIPLIFIITVHGQGIVFSRSTPFTAPTEDTFYIECRLDSSIASAADATFKWFRPNGDQVTGYSYNDPLYISDLAGGGLTLFIASVKDDDAGKYKCVADANGAPYEREFQLDIRASLVLRDCPENQAGVLGKMADINCIANAGGANVLSSWNKDGYKLDVSSSKYSFSSTKMTILNVTRNDAGIYRYMAMTEGNSGEVKLKDIEFKVYVLPVIVNPILATTAVIGKKVEMFCKASGEPLPVIQWYRVTRDNSEDYIGSENSESTDRIIITNKEEDGFKQGILTIENVIKEDGLEYICRASNQANDIDQNELVEARARLTVQIPPTISDMQDQIGVEKSSAQLTCEARGDPVPVLVWQKAGSHVQYTAGYTGENIAAVGEDINDQNNPGARLTLKLSKLTSEAGGTYYCNATNNAGQASKNVSLEVRFSPNFIGQTQTQFYNWADSSDSNYMDCVADGNPEPLFTWKKGDQEITSGTPFYALEKILSNDPKFPYRVTSRLTVSYNGANEQVFGDYSCEAKNTIDGNTIVLTMTKATVPPKPTVRIGSEGATQMEFLLEDPNVAGPEVTHFRYTYVRQGSPDSTLEGVVSKENRDHSDFERRVTKVIVNDLLPNTKYVFTFYARNAVGDGPGEERPIQTQNIRKPDPVVINNRYISGESTAIQLLWDEPKDGGAQILYYTITYQMVNVKNSTDPTKPFDKESARGDVIQVESVKDIRYRITGLLPGHYYEVKIAAVNNVGTGVAGITIIQTKPGDEGGLSTGAIIGIVVGVFFILFIIVDVTCYFKNKCGILMSIKEKVGGSPGEDGYSAAKTEDVENLAKKDELTEEAKAAEEGENAATDDEKKEPLLSSEEQKVETVDEGDVKPEVKEVEPEDKDPIKPDPPKPETPAVEEKAPTPPAPLEETPAAPVAETPAEKPTPAPRTDKPQE